MHNAELRMHNCGKFVINKKTMETIVLKRKKLITEIQRSKNENLLDELYQFIQRENQLEDIYYLSDEQKKAIAVARQQIDTGEFYSNDDVEEEISKWLER